MATNNKATDATPAAMPVTPIPPGLRCPNCSSVSLTCEYTRKLPGQLVRVRKCKDCDRRCRTVEKVTGALPQTAKQIADAKANGMPPSAA